MTEAKLPESSSSDLPASQQATPQPPHEALQKARLALQTGDRAAARYWAQRAAASDPAHEEAWLILASVAHPKASVAYLQKALEINPASVRAQKGLQWALERLSDLSARPASPPTVQPSPEQAPPDLQSTAKVPVRLAEPPIEAGDTAPRRLAARGRVTYPIPSAALVKPRQAVWLYAVVALVATALIAGWYFWPALSRVFNAASIQVAQGGLLAKETRTPSPTPEPTNTTTPLPTSTPLPTDTPFPTETPLPTSTATPLLTDTPTTEPTATATAKSTSAKKKKKQTKLAKGPAAPKFRGRPQGVGADEPWVDIDLSSQSAYAYQGDQLMRSFLVSTGTWLHPTVTGQFSIYVMYKAADMSGPGYYLPSVPYVMYFYQDYGLHGTYWHHNFGTPMSHGCINFSISDAAWLYSFVHVGTTVNVHQ